MNHVFKKKQKKKKNSPDVIKKQSVIVRWTKQFHYENKLKNPQVHTPKKMSILLVLETVNYIRSKEYLVK